MPAEQPVPAHPTSAVETKTCPSCRNPTSTADSLLPTPHESLARHADAAVLCAHCSASPHAARNPRVWTRPARQASADSLESSDDGADAVLEEHFVPEDAAEDDNSTEARATVYPEAPKTLGAAAPVSSGGADVRAHDSPAPPPPKRAGQADGSGGRPSANAERSPAVEGAVSPATTKAEGAAAAVVGRSAPLEPYASALDPLVDISRLRIRPKSYRSLYPGASFQGAQKNGKSSYDVTVTIVDIDMPNSFACGYLCIRNLTDEWPEMTTYFDAEIIGSRYGFVTGQWDATEKDDLAHWARFPAFRHAKAEAHGPRLTIPDRDRGAVFMRWKEKFLVPDHRVQDISGASFAGFYYVCVEFDPQHSVASPVRTASQLSADGTSTAPRRMSAAASPMMRRSSSHSHRGGAPTASMNGFYYHQTSQPDQQLCLNYVQQKCHTGFEFR